MRLMLLRHAKAEKAEAGASDHARRLNARGVSDTALIGAYLARHELSPAAAVVSTAARTRETWEGLAAALPETPPVTFEERLYNAGAQGILTLVQATAPKLRSLMVIAHNPGLHDLVRLLIAAGDVEARERLNENLPTAGLAVIDFAADSWRKVHPQGGRLERFVSPRTLAEAHRV